MGSQYIYVIIAIFLFMNLVVTLNNHKKATAESMINNQVQNDAIALAQSIIERGWSVKFDDLEDEFDNPGKWQKFTFGAGDLYVQTTVDYAAFDSNGYTSTTSKTSYKLLWVIVSDESRSFTIELQHVFTEL